MPNWTKDQEKVITTRGENILVSAAAGSGKTAVLVERIIGKIINDKVGIDNLLVVTFTNAAAREMKDRIRKALKQAMRDDFDNEFLIAQNTLITTAEISTIDSFCLNLVKNNYNDIGIDPGFRICDENEEELLFQEAVDNVLENNFEEDNNDIFIKLMDLYTKTGDYSEVYNTIKGLYKRAVSYPWPDIWLDNISKPYNVKEGTKLNDIEWISEMFDSYINELKRIKYELECYLENIEPHLVPDKKGTNFTSDTIKNGIDYIDVLLNSDDMGKLYDNVLELYDMYEGKAKMGKGEKRFLKSVDLCDEEASKLYASYESLCDSYNNIYIELIDNRVDDLLKEIDQSALYANTLISLTRQVMDIFDEIKTRQNVVTFSDVEHLALDILIDPETKTATDTAIELKKKYDEVMVDEYQDINELQETILSTISNGTNMFMVGDVKQSIYGFRMAKPDIFVKKFDAYNEDDKNGVSINLKKNFRSRPEVLDVVNDIFLHIMTKKTSGFEYDDRAKLYFGAEELYDDDISSPVEILIGDSDTDEYETSRKIEATIVAKKIRDLIDNHHPVKEKNKDKDVIIRDIRYSDIAIILRAANTNGKDYEEALLDYNIPCLSSGAKGYFDTVEVRLILSFLAVIDNPCRDIELASILHSPLFDIDNNTLAKIKINADKNDNKDDKKFNYLYYDIKDYIDFMTLDESKEFATDDDQLDKLIKAIEYIDELRSMVYDTPIHELIEMIYDKTSYLDYVSSLVGGQIKRANLLALIDKALEYEKTSFRGVFRFLRYIDALKEYDIDTSEASISSENDDVVRILTMHKSKGLEFPVVFVSDLSSDMRNMDLNNTNLIHNSLGLGMQLRGEDNGNKYKKDTQYKNYVKRKIKLDFMAEEARLLYVAATRAKEKLFLTAVFNNPEETINKYLSGSMNYNKMVEAKNRMEWIIRGIATSNYKSLDSMITYTYPEPSDVKDIIEYSYISNKKEKFIKCVDNVSNDITNRIKERLSYEYPYEINDNIKSKYSVSDIKHNAMKEAFEEEPDLRPDFIVEEKASVIPDFIKESDSVDVNMGALYGTAMHRVMECYDFIRDDYVDSIDEQIKYMTDRNLLTKMQHELIKVDKIRHFLSSDIARRMHMAAQNELLYIEQPFVLEENPKNIFDDASNDFGNIIIQGIIDVFYVEDGKVVLLDYKTDKILDENELIKRYSAQIDLYAKAIEKSTHLKVKEKILYSFCLDKTVYID